MGSREEYAERIAELEAELRGEREQTELAERAARIGAWRHWLADGRLTWSPGMYRLLDVDPSKPPDNAWLLSQIRPEDVANLQQTINLAIRTRTPFHYRTHARYADAAAQIVDTHGELEIGPDGRVISVIGVCHDVTKQVIAETERAQAEERYRVMMEEASDIIMLHGVNGRVEFVSSALERILGRPSTDFDGLAYLDYVHPDDIAEAQKISTRPPPGEARTATYRVMHSAGHYVWCEVTIRAVYDEADGAFRRIVAVSRDVTARKRQELEMLAAREAAEAASRAKSTFLANMSHELRTPLNAILGFADIMRGEMFGPITNTRYREYVSLIRNSGQLLLDLIGDILDMAKIEAGKLELHYETVSVSEILEQCAHIVADSAGQSAVSVRVHAAPLACSADRRALKQIVLNLLSNAVKFTPAGGNVDLSCELVDDRVRIRISDTGIGIAKADLPRLTMPFEQVCADATLAKKGTGLGLALVRALAEKHGGSLAIESRQNHGTTVTVEFPQGSVEQRDVA